ncbi:8-oxo-dGTP diphosphatase MutT [Shewanella fidelis]|uniref:8-oxo-dGTP diphosphatase n=1 Tax=Shewanella fidelis TaxID=173509 RepID=A0AAW8NRI7_9GAMM|nr:8-oxo-dGTP diphosphatase MutT [Shewanella fidelis]MDR8525400.1 8-oxo-dGTP diphosphatase MutT [Shewanella fidelis]MDW4813564.1 8-oxo-dGTP diphosphatase MutT [Shewanella fidelis]MDW4817778.1 8-oxo-dGTP diphosphatase MutT [Shewanella fidelis]MDW4821845.1 8-oxo-dGTP diphosphatase MutT [Shewanella fidelis]MDW4825892.1 8-oxo-dGTP diphosphatase MutT [Shewanella fidelis]
MKLIHVAVGVIKQGNRILLAKRPLELHQGGKWEFPGGKVEQDETTSEALIRELKEEVNLDVMNTSPMMEIHHDYGDKKVFLDIHWVENFTGTAQGMEGQQVCWVEKEDLQQYDFPEANKAILEKILS